MTAAAARCGPEYDSHAWRWADSDRQCRDCGLVDLAGERIMREIALRLGVPRSAFRL